MNKAGKLLYDEKGSLLCAQRPYCYFDLSRTIFSRPIPKTHEAKRRRKRRRRRNGGEGGEDIVSGLLLRDHFLLSPHLHPPLFFFSRPFWLIWPLRSSSCRIPSFFPLRSIPGRKQHVVFGCFPFQEGRRRRRRRRGMSALTHTGRACNRGILNE